MANNLIQKLKNRYSKVKKTVESAKSSASNIIATGKNIWNRDDMIDSAVKREIKRQYPTGLSDSPSAMEIKKKIDKELREKLKKRIDRAHTIKGTNKKVGY